MKEDHQGPARRPRLPIARCVARRIEGVSDHSINLLHDVFDVTFQRLFGDNAERSNPVLRYSCSDLTDCFVAASTSLCGGFGCPGVLEFLLRVCASVL